MHVCVCIKGLGYRWLTSTVCGNFGRFFYYKLNFEFLETLNACYEKENSGQKGVVHCECAVFRILEFKINNVRSYHH